MKEGDILSEKAGDRKPRRVVGRGVRSYLCTAKWNKMAEDNGEL